MLRRFALGFVVILLGLVVLQPVAQARKKHKKPTVSCDSSDGLPDAKTAPDGSQCSTDGDGTGTVKADASNGGSASANGSLNGNAMASASGSGTDADAE